MADRCCDYDEDVQCGRCGSSMGWEDCQQCDGGSVYEDDSETWGEWHTCEWCQGRGGWYLCMSHGSRNAPGEPTWCEAHPNEGRDEVSPGTEEPFIIHQAECPKAKADGHWTELVGVSHPGRGPSPAGGDSQ